MLFHNWIVEIAESLVAEAVKAMKRPRTPTIRGGFTDKDFDVFGL
jgi:hypothetical protein